MRKYTRHFIAAVLVLGILGFAAFQLPPVKAWVEPRVIARWVQFKYWLFPPEEAVFIPQNPAKPALNATEAAAVALQVSATLQALQSTPSPTPAPTSIDITLTPTPTLPPTNTPTPTQTATPLPAAVALKGTRHEYEQWNNCGPATLGMQLSYWGWSGDQRDTAAFLKPNPRDKNVSPHEMVAFVETNTELHALVRSGGTLPLLKSLIAAGFPVIIEKTIELPGLDGWVGHYALVTGYDDAAERLVTQDSYIMADFPLPYAQLQAEWQSFNYTYLVVYPPDQEKLLQEILGANFFQIDNNQTAAEIARQEISTASGRGLFFAWFNLGTNLVALKNYEAAAAAYDTAYQVYAGLDPFMRPWRMVWYQHGPYEAYYETERYQDVIGLANTTLSAMGEQTVEETFYWRGLAYAALGETNAARKDFETALELNSNFAPAGEALNAHP